MPRSLGGVIPDPLRAELTGDDLAAGVGRTYLLLTAAGDGWPHVAMLSVGELLAGAGPNLGLVLWPGSQTTASLTENGIATLMAVVPPATYYLRLRGRRLADAPVQAKPRAIFAAVVEEALEDVVAYAEVTAGIDFKLADVDATISAWLAAVEVMRATLKS